MKRADIGTAVALSHALDEIQRRDDWPSEEPKLPPDLRDLIRQRTIQLLTNALNTLGVDP